MIKIYIIMIDFDRFRLSISPNVWAFNCADYKKFLKYIQKDAIKQVNMLQYCLYNAMIRKNKQEGKDV